MNRSLVISLTAVLLSFDLWGVKASWGSNNDFNDHWLAAACTQVPRGGRLKGKVFQTEYGPAVGHEGGSAGRLVLYCNVDPDLYHNWIQILALDNTPSGYVKATLFQQGVNSAQAPTEIACNDERSIGDSEGHLFYRSADRAGRIEFYVLHRNRDLPSESGRQSPGLQREPDGRFVVTQSRQHSTPMGRQRCTCAARREVCGTSDRRVG